MPFLLVSLVMLSAPINGRITPDLLQQLDSAKEGEMISCIVIMKETYPYNAMENASVHEKIINYQAIARESQKEALAWLETIDNDAKVFQQYWVLNGFCVQAKPWVIKTLADREDVGWISHNGEVHIIAESSNDGAPDSRAPVWNLQKIMADSCWAAGFTGQGIILGETDTGVEYTHPALAGKWSGYWLDVHNGQTTPYDDHGHGTHCMGTIMGGDGPGPFAEDIGVAPGATFAAAKVLNSGGSGSYDQCAQGLQFMADLKDSVDIKAVSNSWAGPNGPDSFFYPITRTYKSIGILPVFANGNNGSQGPGSVQVPGNYSNVVGVGATDSNDDLASFSSLGPAPDAPPFNDPTTWFREDWNLIKPNISAPGVDIHSCVPGGGYENWQGTSMATPHVAGAVGIVCQKNPNLSTTDLYNILLDNADEPSQGAPYPNNNYGWGRLNVWRSLNGTPTTNQPWLSMLSRTITDPPPGGNNNGLVEPGETCELVIEIKNVGGDTALNTTGQLKSFDNFVSISAGFYDFGDLLPQHNGSNSGSPYVFDVHSLTPQGHLARLGVLLHADGDVDTLDFDDTLYFAIQIGTPPPPHVIYEDDYEYGSGIDSFLNYWEVTGNWQRSTAQSHTPTHSAYSGATLDNATYLTLKNAVNLSGYTNPQLKYWHMYNFDSGIFMDDASVQVSTDGGSNWGAMWTYDWLTGNTLPWTEETFNLPASSNVKIRYAIDGYTFFQDYTDWYIDDFEISVPTDNEPPYFANTTVWPDTGFAGPFPVQSMITDATGIDSAALYYRVNSGGWQRLNMTPQGNNVYMAAIPAQAWNTTIAYYLWAKDTWITPNSGCDPVGAPGDGYYEFIVTNTAVSEYGANSVSFAMMNSNPLRGQALFSFSLARETNVELAVYDVTGRKVTTLLDNGFKSGKYRVQWNRFDDCSREVAAGIYFIEFQADDYKKVTKLVLVK